MRRRDDEPGSGRLRGIAEALEAMLKRTGLDKDVKRAGVLALWPAAVGPQIAGVTEARLITEDGTLVVGVRTPQWMTELSLMERQLIAKLAAAGSPVTVRRIRWEQLR